MKLNNNLIIIHWLWFFIFWNHVWEAVRVRSDKANFGPSPIGLIFSVKVNHCIQCTNITFIRSNSIFFILFKTVFKVTSKLANLPKQTLKFCYKCRTLPKRSIFFYQSECFKCKSFIFPRYFNGLILLCQSLLELWIF